MRISRFLSASIIAAASAQAEEFDFSTLGLTSDLDAREGITVTGAGVSDWQDQGSANLDAVQATDGDRPADGGDVLGVNAIDFDVTNSEELDWAMATAAAGTIFVVGQVGATPRATNNDSIVASGAHAPTTAGVQLQHHSDTTVNLRLSDGTSRTTLQTAALAAGANFIIGIRWDGSNRGIRLNGNAEVTNTNGLGSLGTTTFRIGGSSIGNANHCWDGEITRVLAAPSTRLDDTNFAAAFTELNNIYGVF